MKIDNTIFIVETEESEAAHETAEQKIKKLIEAGIDGLIDEERRRLRYSVFFIETTVKLVDIIFHRWYTEYT